jgi:hypothetical protein
MKSAEFNALSNNTKIDRIAADANFATLLKSADFGATVKQKVLQIYPGC